jgi:hypothetical protein
LGAREERGFEKRRRMKERRRRFDVFTLSVSLSFCSGRRCCCSLLLRDQYDEHAKAADSKRGTMLSVDEEKRSGLLFLHE